MLKFVGLGVLVFSVLGGFIFANGNLMALWQPPEILIIAGGAFGAFLLSNPMSVVRSTGWHLRNSFSSGHYQKLHYQKLLTLLYQLFELRRTSGASAMEMHIEDPESSDLFKVSGVLDDPRLTAFICDNLRLVILGNISSHELDSLLDSELYALTEDIGRPADALQKVADALPGFGIVAAVLGIVITMQSMGGPVDQMGVSIAAALVGTFLGVLLGYGIVGPLAYAIEHSIKDQMLMFECAKESMLSHVSGRPSAIAVDAGRRVLFGENRPSFTQLEAFLLEGKG
ncbi:flagellar motor stator protein MotA [Endozoicomonas ascidiicola]|uniref:flagellar motor stator protein MotA n=1 Tax=Endozoicomonas ascidiicola TaxID=1698521 RepID=UPI00082E0710|nr:flagellar motor stator protein MotA [Endozoicomonas ascidiicola]